MVEHLQWLSGSDKPWAAQRAQFALQIVEQFRNGGITESEYHELLADLIRADRLDAEADDLETKTLLVTAIYAVAQIS